MTAEWNIIQTKRKVIVFSFQVTMKIPPLEIAEGNISVKLKVDYDFCVVQLIRVHTFLKRSAAHPSFNFERNYSRFSKKKIHSVRAKSRSNSSDSGRYSTFRTKFHFRSCRERVKFKISLRFNRHRYKTDTSRTWHCGKNLVFLAASCSQF